MHLLSVDNILGFGRWVVHFMRRRDLHLVDRNCELRKLLCGVLFFRGHGKLHGLCAWLQSRQHRGCDLFELFRRSVCCCRKQSLLGMRSWHVLNRRSWILHNLRCGSVLCSSDV